MASERVNNIRDWANLALTLIISLAIPVGALVLKNQRLEITSEMQRNFVSIETYRYGVATTAAENAQLRSQIEVLNAKMDALKITMVRLTDAVKLRDP